MKMCLLYTGISLCKLVAFWQHFINPLKPNSSICYTLPYRPHLPFLISDIRAEIKNGRLGLYGAEHLKSNRMTNWALKG